MSVGSETVFVAADGSVHWLEPTEEPFKLIWRESIRYVRCMAIQEHYHPQMIYFYKIDNPYFIFS